MSLILLPDYNNKVNNSNETPSAAASRGTYAAQASAPACGVSGSYHQDSLFPHGVDQHVSRQSRQTWEMRVSPELLFRTSGT
jgi:hypothetical protein